MSDHPDEIRLDRLRKFPEHLGGKATALWDMKSAVGIIAAQSWGTPTSNARVAARFGPFRDATNDICVRCGFLIPSVHCGTQVCTKTGWCESCARIPPNVSGNLLRECLNLRRCRDEELRDMIENWEEYFVPSPENAWPFKSKKEAGVVKIEEQKQSIK